MIGGEPRSDVLASVGEGREGGKCLYLEGEHREKGEGGMLSFSPPSKREDTYIDYPDNTTEEAGRKLFAGKDLELDAFGQTGKE